MFKKDEHTMKSKQEKRKNTSVSYIKDFKNKFPNCKFNEVEVCEKFCVNQMYKNKDLKDCKKEGTVEDCIICWYSNID